MGKEVLLNLYPIDYRPKETIFTVFKPAYEINKEKLNKVRWRVFLETGLPTFRRGNEFWCAGKVEKETLYLALKSGEIVELKKAGEREFKGFSDERECQELLRDYLFETKVKDNFVKEFYGKFKERITIQGKNKKIALIPEVNEKVLRNYKGNFLLHLDLKFRIHLLETLQTLLEKNSFNPKGIRVKPIGMEFVDRILNVFSAREKDEEFFRAYYETSTHEISKKAWEELLKNRELRKRTYLVVLESGYIYPATILKPVLTYEELGEEEREEVVDIVRMDPIRRLKLIRFILKRYVKSLKNYGWLISTREEKTERKLNFRNIIVDAKGRTTKVVTNLRKFLELCRPFIKKNPLLVEVISVSSDDKLERKKREFLIELTNFLKNKGVEFRIKRKSLILAKTRIEAKERLITVLDRIKGVDLVVVFLEEYSKTDPYRSFLLYDFIKQELLKRMIPSQIILNKTLKKDNLRFVLLNVAEQVLAKTGNVPYKLKEIEGDVDAFVGIDVSRITLDGKTLNTVAFTKIFNSRGELVRYYLTSYQAFGEKLTEKVIGDVFSVLKKLGFEKGSKVVIHRDGRFYGNEVKAFLKYEKLYGYSLELLEIIKRNNPRFFSENKFIKGYFYKLTEDSAILATYNQVYEGTHQPIRVRKVYGEMSIEVLSSQVLSLTLMNYSSFQPIKLPATVHYSDKITKLMLRGIEPLHKEGDIMYWL